MAGGSIEIKLKAPVLEALNLAVDALKAISEDHTEATSPRFRADQALRKIEAAVEGCSIHDLVRVGSA